jgi:hypothetical protein
MVMPKIMAITMITGKATIIMTMITSVIIRMVNLIDTVATGRTTMASVESGQVFRLGQDLGVLPPPLWGRDGEGGSRCVTRCVRQLLPPPLTPPHKGEGNTEPAANVCLLGTTP